MLCIYVTMLTCTYAGLSSTTNRNGKTCHSNVSVIELKTRVLTTGFDMGNTHFSVSKYILALFGHKIKAGRKRSD